MKLISMTEFVLSYKYNNEVPIYNYQSDKLRAIERYANFLNKPLELGMFVPCDEEGNVLEYPKWHTDDIKDLYKYYLDFGFGVPHPTSEVDKKSRNAINVCKQYKEAKERVLFEDCKIEDGELMIGDYCFHYGTDKHGFYLESEYPHTSVECLSHLDLMLTESAQKQF